MFEEIDAKRLPGRLEPNRAQTCTEFFFREPSRPIAVREPGGEWVPLISLEEAVNGTIAAAIFNLR